MSRYLFYGLTSRSPSLKPIFIIKTYFYILSVIEHYLAH